MSTALPVRSTRQLVAHDHTPRALMHPTALVATALRTKSVHSREILAELAWPGHTPAALDQWAADRGATQTWGACAPEWSAGPAEGMVATWVARYAHVLAVQTGDAAERHRARVLLEVAATDPEWAKLPANTREMLLHLRVLDRDRAGGLRLVDTGTLRPDVVAAARADLHNPFLFPDLAADSPQEAHRVWLTTFNAALHREHVADISLCPAPQDQCHGQDQEHGDPTPFDRLTTEPLERVETDARVSVLMSAYRPGPALLVAVRSVLAQTWGDLELLIVDDASGPGYDGILEQAAGLDPRVRVIRKAINGGTYRARNTALRQATGSVAAILDSDDWWHPQALELGMRPLRRHRHLMATRSQGVRVGEQLDLTRPGYRPRFVSAASLVFRIAPVLEQIGFFDPAGKGADTEFVLRMQAALGKVVQDVLEVLTLVRGGQTLSSADFSNGWRHPARHEYKLAYAPWHAAIETGRDTAYLDDTGPRRFVQPQRWARPSTPLLGPPACYDLCLAGDWRRYGGPQRSMLEELAAARAAGLRVAVMHLEALRFMSTADGPLCRPVQELLTSGEVDRINPDDDVDVDVLLVRYPPILQYPPSVRTVLRTRHLLIVANQAPLEPDGSDQRYVVADVQERAQELFGQPPTWLPQGPVVRRVLLEQEPDLPITTWDNPGLIDADRWRCRGDSTPGRQGIPVVVGRYSRDDAIKFPPTWGELVEGYRFGAGYQVRMMGASDAVVRLSADAGGTAEQLPENWRVLPQGSVEPREFLAGLDFFVYLDHPDRREAFGRTLLEAAASGVLTIAHPKHRVTYGDAIDYALPGEAQTLVAHYVTHPEAYRARVETSLRLVAQRYGHHRFVEQIRELASGPTQASTASEVPAPASSAPGAVGQDRPAPRRDLRLQLRTGPQRSVRVQAEPRTVVVSVPIRSAADAGHADQVVAVCHTAPGGHDDPLAGHDVQVPDPVVYWLADQLAQVPEDTVPDALLASAPADVHVVLVQQEGLVHLAGRGTWSAAASPGSLLDLAGADQAGWDHRVSWSWELPAQLSLSLTRG